MVKKNFWRSSGSGWKTAFSSQIFCHLALSIPLQNNFLYNYNSLRIVERNCDSHLAHLLQPHHSLFYSLRLLGDGESDVALAVFSEAQSGRSHDACLFQQPLAEYSMEFPPTQAQRYRVALGFSSSRPRCSKGADTESLSGAGRSCGYLPRPRSGLCKAAIPASCTAPNVPESMLLLILPIPATTSALPTTEPILQPVML